MKATLYSGDCLDVLPTLASASVDSVVSDPPYAEIDRPYGRLTEVEWFDLMRAVVGEVHRVLKPTGSAVFILQPNSEYDGRMRGWLWEFMAWVCREWNMVQDAWWWNPSAIPAGGAPTVGLLRPSVKACVWLGPPRCYRNQGAVLWTESRDNMTRRATARAERRYDLSGHDVNPATMRAAAVERGGVTPFNLLPFGKDAGPGPDNHGAMTPYALCSWWVRYLTRPGGTVLDPFSGRGTVGEAALGYNCDYIGIERDASYHAMAERNLSRVAPLLATVETATAEEQPA